MTIYDKIREPEDKAGIQPSPVAPRRTIYDAIRGADAQAAPLPAATAPAGPAPAQAVASAPVIPSAPASPVAAAPIAAPSAEPAPAAPPAAPRFGQPGYNPLLHGGDSKAPLDLRINRALGIKDYRDEGPPTSAQIDDSRKEWWQKPEGKPPEPEDKRNPFEKISDWATKDTYVGQQAASFATLALDFIPATIRGVRGNTRMMIESVVGEKGADIVGKVTRGTPYGWMMGESKALDSLLDASGNLRANAKARLMKAAKKQGGMTGAVIAGVSEGIADTILALKTMQALKVGYGQEAVKAGAPWFAKSWSVVKSAAVRAGIMTARTPHDNPKEFAKAYGLSLAYQSTPAISRHFKDTASVIAADIALNSGITATQVKGLIDSAWAQAEAEGGAPEQVERNAAIYATISMIQTIGSDIVFGAMTRAFKDAPPPVRDALEQAKAQAAKVGNDLPTAKPMPVPVDDSVRGPETNPVLATPERPVLISNQREEARAEEGERISAPEEPAARVNPLLEPERVAQAAAQAERPAEPQAEVPRPAEQVAAPEAARPPIEQARDEAGAPDVAPREATSRLDESKHPTVELPIKSLKLSADVPNFKEGASETGEVEPLQGRYERLGTPPVVVWERTNGDREIITGRHRWNLAKRSGEKTIPAQVVREADGFTKDDAAIFDAEANIRDGQGSVKDYANFFKKRGISREEASSSGLLSREKGRDGYEIGTSASDDLYALFAAGKISPRKAAAIAKQAPGQPEAQKLGMDYAEKHNAEQTEQYMRAVVSMAPKSSDKQLDLLGWDDSWQIQADKMGRAASDIRGELSAERTSLKHALSLTGKRQAEVVKKYGFKTGDKDAIKDRVGELERELISWENWNLDAELTATVRERAGLPPVEKPAASDSFKLESASKAELDAEAKRLADKAKLDDMAIAPLEGRPDADIGQSRLPGTGGEIDLFNAPKQTPEAAPRTAADLAKPAKEPAQEPAPKPTTPLAKAIAEAPQAFRVTSSRGNVHNVKMPDGTTYPIRAESKAEAVAKAQELASRTPEDVIDDSIRMVEDAKAQEEKGAKGGYVSTGAAAPVERVLRRAMEGFFGHMRAFGEQYVSDRPLMRRFEQAYHERAAAVESGIADIRKILVEAGPRRLEDGVAVAIAIEEGVARDTLPPSARRLYDLSKQTMDAITDLEKAEGVLKKGFPDGTRDAINEKIAEIQAKRKMNKADMEAVSKLQEELAVLDKFAAYLPHGIVARRVMQKIFEEGNGRARRDLGNRLEQFHRQRKGRSTLREYLEAGVIRPDDMDIGKLMMDSAVSAYQKISMKALMDYGIENKYIRFGHKAPGDPKEWFEMPQLAKPAQVFKVSPPSGQKVWVHRLFGLGLEELSGAQNKPTTAFDKVLSIVKVGQFYNPKIIWSYNLQQRIYGGAVEWNPVKDAINTKDAWRAVLTDNEDYQQANRLGIFQVPDNLPRATVDSQIDIATRSMRTDLSRGGVIGNQLVKVLERATGEKMDPQSWKDKNLRAALDAIMLPLRGISSATWTGDKVQRMHTFYNLTRRGMSPQDAAEQTARMHGAYSKIGKEYKAWARRVFFVHSFRLLMPIQTMRAYTTPIKIALKALTGKDIPQGETRRAIMALAGTVLFPTLIDSALRYNGWTPTEEEEEFFKKGPMKYLRIPVGKDGYRVTLALPNWKYKKTFMYDGEEREVVLGVNNIANMATKWIMRAAPKDNIVSPTTKDLPIMTLLKWEISPLYRIGMDIFDNNSSFGTAPPRGSTGKDWDSAVGYLFGNIWRMYGDAYRMVSDDRESDVYKERQRAEMMEAMNLGDRVLQNVFGYAYTRAGPEKRVGSMINALRRSAGAARSTAEIHYKGETLEEKIAEIDILEAKMERTLRRRYNIPRPPAEIVRIITDPGLADNPSKQANAARLAKYGMDGITAKDLRTALVKEAREQGWNREMYDSKGKLTAYGQRKLRLSRFIRKHNIE